jgi:hypothetical protein
MNPMSDMPDIQQVLDQMIPRSLDDIVRLNRDQMQIGLATLDELSAQAGVIELGQTLDTIDEWRVVAIRQRGAPPLLSLLGHVVGTSRVRMTSEIIMFDVCRGLCRTRNSLYRLGLPGDGEPPQEDLICACAILHQWGIGRTIGAPEFFF